ncbi:MAG: DUF6484 domain-containing protein [Marinagarivorans sp.]|nr:DUF6484 domain-containing protein [Marinagarivorans sp.]
MEKESILESASNTDEANNLLAELGAGDILIGRLESIDEEGGAMVSVPQLPSFKQRIALTTVAILRQHIGRQVALMFTQGTNSKPIIMGLIHSPLQSVLENILENSCNANANTDEVVFAEPLSAKQSKSPQSSDGFPLANGGVYIDGKSVVLEGQDEVVLRCGEASITLNKNGKISIRGKYILNRASDVNRILGASVQVN